MTSERHWLADRVVLVFLKDSQITNDFEQQQSYLWLAGRKYEIEQINGSSFDPECMMVRLVVSARGTAQLEDDQIETLGPGGAGNELPTALGSGTQGLVP